MYAPKFRHWMSDADRVIERRIPEIQEEIAAKFADARAWLDTALPEQHVNPYSSPYANYRGMINHTHPTLSQLLRLAVAPEYSYQQMQQYAQQMGLRTTFPL